MSVKHGLLALLSAQPSTTYQLRKRFDESTGQIMPLNIGQVSTTMQRLERDGLVIRDGEDGDPEAGTGQPWELTAAGRVELISWWASPVVTEVRGRDELVVKMALAAVVPGVDIATLVQTQRESTQRTLHDLTRLRRDVATEDLVGRLVLDHHLFQTEATLRWLDDVESTLLRVAERRPSANQSHPASAKPRPGVRQ